MAEDKLSAREAALIAQARAQLSQSPAARGDAPSGPERVRAKPPAAAIDSAAPSAPARAMGPAERAAALMAAARAESEELRRRQRRLYVRAPLAFLCVAGLWALLWLWHRL